MFKVVTAGVCTDLTVWISKGTRNAALRKYNDKLHIINETLRAKTNIYTDARGLNPPMWMDHWPLKSIVTHLYVTFEIKNFAEPFAVPFPCCPVETARKAQEKLGWTLTEHLMARNNVRSVAIDRRC